MKFQRYLYLFLTAIFISSFALVSNAHDNEPPNTIAGLKKSAKIGDYALLRGQFVRKFEDDIFEFADDSKKAIFVSFEGVKVPQDLSFGYEYFLWGQVLENDKTTVLQALFLSPKMFSKEHNY